MNDKMINSEKIRLGKITYYDVEHNGSVVPSVDAYVFMININDTYITHYINYVYIIYYSNVIGSLSTLNFSFLTLIVLVAP